MAAIELRNLTRRYEGAEGAALRGLDLDVRDGELLCVVGPSGCGKSTTLRLIAGLDAPDAGTIAIDGRDVGKTPPQDRDVAMVFQGYALYPHLTVEENIAFPLRMRGVARAERERRVRDASALLSIERLLKRTPGELSGGERQRVAMGRAIVRSPKAFLFDEPLSNLDAALRSELRVEIGSLVRRLGTTSIYVTHDQVEAMTLGDRILVMRAGTIEQLGTPRAIYEDPATSFVAGFLGTPPCNLVDTVRDEDRLVSGQLDVPVPQGLGSAERVTIGLRPEHLALGQNGSGDALSIPGEVVAAEPLGAETHLHVDTGGARLRARVPGWNAPARGETVRLSIDRQRILYFDAATGARLRPAAEAG
jgi:multiple sugar transport system ATP-binding protein